MLKPGISSNCDTISNITKGSSTFQCLLIYTKDEFKIEPRYAHKKKLRQTREKNHVLEMDHHRALKFENFLGFFMLFNCKIVFINQFLPSI